MVGTHLGGEVVERVGLDGVDGQRVVAVDGSETSRDCIRVSHCINRMGRIVLGAKQGRRDE